MEAYEGITLYGALARAEEYDTDGKCGIAEELISVHRFYSRGERSSSEFSITDFKGYGDRAGYCVKYISFYSGGFNSYTVSRWVICSYFCRPFWWRK